MQVLTRTRYTISSIPSPRILPISTSHISTDALRTPLRVLTTRLQNDAHRRALRAEVPVGVDLHLGAAVAEDALRHDGHGVHALVLGGDDEGRGLVVRVGGAGADAGDEGARRVERGVRVRG